MGCVPGLARLGSRAAGAEPGAGWHHLSASHSRGEERRLLSTQRMRVFKQNCVSVLCGGDTLVPLRFIKRLFETSPRSGDLTRFEAEYSPLVKSGRSAKPTDLLVAFCF